MCDSVNHTRIPEEYTYQTEYVGINKIIKGERVQSVQVTAIS